MSLEVLALGLFSALRPGTSLAAVLALLKTPRPQRPLLFFIAAGLAWTWVVGLLVVAVFHGANVALGGWKVTAALDVALGAAALGFAAGVQRGSIQPRRRSSAQAGHGLAARPAPAQPVRPCRGRRRGRHASTRAHLPGRAQRDRLRTARTRERRCAGGAVRRAVVPDSARGARAGRVPSGRRARLPRGRDRLGATSRNGCCSSAARWCSARTSSPRGWRRSSDPVHAARRGRVSSLSCESDDETPLRGALASPTLGGAHPGDREETVIDEPEATGQPSGTGRGRRYGAIAPRR